MFVHAIKCIIYRPTYNMHKLYVVGYFPSGSIVHLVVDKSVFVCVLGEGH